MDTELFSDGSLSDVDAYSDNEEVEGRKGPGGYTDGDIVADREPAVKPKRGGKRKKYVESEESDPTSDLEPAKKTKRNGRKKDVESHEDDLMSDLEPSDVSSR
jgi:hypothetical protein